METLFSVWRRRGKNKESVAELFIGMLHFYCEKIDFRQTVIAVRQSQPLTRREKRWPGKCLAIEDPFKLDHNLGARLTGCMNKYIQEVFENALLMFSKPQELHPQYRSLQHYLFDRKQLTLGLVPPGPNCVRWTREAEQQQQQQQRSSSGNGQGRDRGEMTSSSSQSQHAATAAGASQSAMAYAQRCSHYQQPASSHYVTTVMPPVRPLMTRVYHATAGVVTYLYGSEPHATMSNVRQVLCSAEIANFLSTYM